MIELLWHYLDMWRKVEHPEKRILIYKHLVCDKIDISNQQGKESLFSKWCWLTPWKKI